MNKNNISNKEINLFIGLKKQDMKTTIKKQIALKTISNALLNVGVIGFNVSSIYGYWDGKKENALLIKFINTFKINKKQLHKAILQIKKQLDQEAILIQINPTVFEFQ